MHAMENISVTETKKGTHVTSPSEDNAHLFFYHKGIVHFEFLEQGRTVTSIDIWKYWQGYVRLFVGEDLKFGLMLRSCIMRMPLLMTRSLSGRFWPRNRY
jgi:hypothetical protein